MRALFLLLCVLPLAACTADPNDPGAVLSRANAQVTAAMQNQGNAQAMVIQATAVRQRTLDWISDQERLGKINGTSTSIAGDARATSDLRTHAAGTSVARAQTAEINSANETATAVPKTRAGETLVAASMLATSVALTNAQSVDTAATRRKIEDANAEAKRKRAWDDFVADFGRIAAPIALIATVACAMLGLLFFLRERQVSAVVIVRENGRVVGQMRPGFVSAPKFEWIDPRSDSEPLALRAPSESAEPPMETEHPLDEAMPVHDAQLLELAAQPRALFVPMGILEDGKPLWLSLVEADGFLIAAMRGMGKTNLLHGIVQSLIHGRRVRLVLFDGKNGVEFLVYRGRPKVRVVLDGDLGAVLNELTQELAVRQEHFRARNVADIDAYNKLKAGDVMDRVALVIDELAFALREPGVGDRLVDLCERGRAFGIHPIFATQYPTAKIVPGELKTNLATRIAFHVADSIASRVALDRAGAENLPRIPGRFLLKRDEGLTVVQAYLVRRPDPIASTENPLFSERDLEIARMVIDKGWFKQPELAALLGVGTKTLGRLAKQWEVQGLLTRVEKDPRGQNAGRRPTEKLVHLVKD